WGLINKAVPDDELMTDAEALARTLASGPTKAFGKVKQMLQSTFSETLESQMEIESRNIADLTRTTDLNEGLAAFIEKRRPEYKGR
ncbi:MAG: enoyl-CoA hydratase, partial [Acidimicrobiia bacterium]|nr:enoyl-CoA hydratase [Acidimicrobiia bacterium]